MLTMQDATLQQGLKRISINVRTESQKQTVTYLSINGIAAQVRIEYDDQIYTLNP